MRAAINLAGGLLWFPLQALVITRLLRGDWRKYPLIFAFVTSEFLVYAAQFPTVWAVSLHQTPDTLSWHALFYQRGEIFLEFFTFVVVISLIFRATDRLQSRNLMRVACVVGAFLLVGISYLVHYRPNITVGLWMTPWTRDLNVGTTILDLALWSLLLAQRKSDERLLLLSGALGIKFTGAAIGNSLRSEATRLHRWPTVAGGMIGVATTLIQVYLWARAFRSAPQPAAREGFVLDAPSQRG